MISETCPKRRWIVCRHDRAGDALQRNDLDSWSDEIALIIDLHGKMRAYQDERFPLVEVFRRADLAEFSIGVIKGDVPGAVMREVKAAFPNAGFPKRRMQLAGGWFAKHLLNPSPFMKW